jgi:lipooligosaccharide transport system permease protein
MLAASAMNGSLFDATFGVFFKLKYEKVYDAVPGDPAAAGRRSQWAS